MSSRSSSSSDELPPAALLPVYVSMCFYNVGIQNNEVAGRSWPAKVEKLKRDIRRIFSVSGGVQALFICEFGNMLSCIDGAMRQAMHRRGVAQPAAHAQPSTQSLFEYIVQDMDGSNLVVHADPPYVALVSRDEWTVVGGACKMKKLCTNKDLFAQQIRLRHVRTSEDVLVFNCHVPSKGSTETRKKDVVQNLMQVGNDALSSGVAKPAAAWIVGGDMNMSKIQLMAACSFFVTPGEACFSISGTANLTKAPPQKSDIAISQGIILEEVDAWVGANHTPCVSDVHDMVLVAGSLEGMALPHPPPDSQTQSRSYKDALVPPPPPLTPAPPKPVLLPLWHAVQPVPPAATAEMQRGEPSSSVPALPRASAPRDDAHPAPPTPPAPPAKMQRGEPSSSDPTTEHHIRVADDVISQLSDCVDQNSAEHHSEAAEDLLGLLLADCDGLGVKSRADIHALMFKPMQIRQDFILHISHQRAHEHKGCADNTVEHWQQYLSKRELSHEDMGEALNLWKGRFEAEDMHPATKQQADELWAKGTRESKHLARGECVLHSTRI